MFSSTSIAMNVSKTNAFVSNDFTSRFRAMSVARGVAAPRARHAVGIENLHGMSGRKCMLTGKKANNAIQLSFSHIRTKILQQPNLQYKYVYWPEQKRYVRLRISANAMKTLNKLGLEEMAKRAGLDLMSLSYKDADPERKTWLKANGAAPVIKDKRAAKGPKPLYVPKWKESKLAKMSADAAKKEKARFAKANNMVVA